MEDLIYKYALQNAIKYGGKANAGSVIAKVVAEDPSLKNEMKQLGKSIALILKKVNSMKIEKQAEELKKIAPDLLEEKKRTEERTLPPLPNAGSKVVLRVAPYPSGPLHIGNAKQVILNDEYAKIYKGKLILVMDDTIGSEEKAIEPEAYDLIIDGLKWLGVNFDKNIIYKSDRLEIYYKHAEEIIHLGAAYVCNCPAELLRENRKKSIACGCRNRTVSQNLDEWREMLRGKYSEGSAVLRIRTDINHPNPAFRDRILFRISEREHPRTKNKYNVWPMLEFSWAVDDVFLGITHVIRGKELMIESDMERFIWNILNWKGPELLHSGLLTIEGVKLSKSKSRDEVKKGIYSGWDDPRTWSLQSLKRRGFKSGAIRNFCLSFGLHEKESHVTVDKFYAENRKLIEPEANRYFFVEDPVEMVIQGAPEKEVSLRLHPDFPERGSRKFLTSGKFLVSKKDFGKLENGMINRLMDCLNFTKKGKEFVFHSENYEKYKNSKNKGMIIHYVPAENFVNAEVIMDDGRISKCAAESSVVGLKPGDIVQAERMFYCVLDSVNEGVYNFWFMHP